MKTESGKDGKMKRTVPDLRQTAAELEKNTGADRVRSAAGLKGIRRFLLSIMLMTGALSVGAEDIVGRVMNQDGEGVSGVLVTNCADVTRTDSDGGYVLPRRVNSRFVSVVTPGSYACSRFFQRLSAEPDQTYNFRLKPKKAAGEFTFIQITDTEDESSPKVQALYPRIADAVHNARASFIVHTGDIHTPDDQKYHASLAARNYFGVPYYLVQGNHDLKTGGGRGETCYEDNVGPLYYGFEEGNVLFVVLPMKKDGDNPAGFTRADIARFFANMMAATDRRKPVIILNHFPEMIDYNGIFGADTPTPVDTRKWNIRGWVYGHMHDSRVTTIRTGLKFFVPGDTFKGPGAGQVANYRFFHVAKDGTLTSRLLPTFVDKQFDVRISPSAQPDGTRVITAAAADMSRLAESVELTILPETGKAETLRMSHGGDWQWTAAYSFDSNQNYTVEAVVHWNSGEKMEKEIRFPEKTAETPHLELERIVPIPGGRVPVTAPLAVNGVLYVGTNEDVNGNAHTLCSIDAASGKMIWSALLLAGVRNSAVYENGTVYVTDTDSNLYAFEAETGKRLWLSRGPAVSNFPPNSNGIAVGGGMVFGGHLSAALRAVDARTGKEIWRVQDKSRGRTITCPMLMDGKLIVCDGGYGRILIAYDAKTGRKLWERSFTHRFGLRARPFSRNSILLAGTMGIWIVDIHTGKTIRSTNPEWQGDEPHGATDSIPVWNQTFLFYGTDDSMSCYDLKTFKRRWSALDHKFPGPEPFATVPYCFPGRNVNASAALTDDVVIFPAGDGFLYECSQQDGSLRGKIELGCPVNTSVTLADGRLFVIDYANRLFIFKLKTGGSVR